MNNLAKLTSKKVLVVEPSLFLSKTLVKKLEDLSLKTILCTNQADALEALSENVIDMVITTTVLPDSTGLKLCYKIRKSEYANIPVLIISGNDEARKIELGFQAGASAFLSKKNLLADLEKRVRSLLNLQGDRNYRLLIVDSSEKIRNTILSRLKMSNFLALGSGDIDDATVKMHHFNPDIILCDSEIPNLTKSQIYRSETPIIMMSNQSDHTKLEKELMDRASIYLVKPFYHNQLLIHLEKLIAERHSQLHDQRDQLLFEHQAMLGSISSLAEALEARDAYTRGHSEGVAYLGVQIAKELNLAIEQQEHIEIAGMLHDIGKVGVPDSVLLKPDKLTDQEFDIIQQHPVIGADILRPIEALNHIIPGVLYHHEKIDGSGYPEGLRGEEIPLIARILAVADIWNALTTSRPYRSSMPEEKALNIIIESKGKHLCSECTDAFLRFKEKNDQLKTEEYISGKKKSIMSAVELK